MFLLLATALHGWLLALLPSAVVQPMQASQPLTSLQWLDVAQVSRGRQSPSGALPSTAGETVVPTRRTARPENPGPGGRRRRALR